MFRNTRIAAVAVCILACLNSGNEATAGTVFVDDFNDGNAEDEMPVTWVPNSGTWDASSGDYTSAGTMIRLSVVPEHVLGDTSVRTSVRLTGNGSQGLGGGIAFRRMPGNNLVGYGGSVLDNGTIGFLRVDGAPIPTILGASVAPFDVLGQDVMLQVDAFGDELSLWAWPAGEPMPASPQVVVTDSTYATGTVGLYSNETPGVSTFRFVHAANMHIPEPPTITLIGMASVALISCGSRRNVFRRRAG